MEKVFDTQEIISKLGRFIKVEPIKSTRSGESVRNQYNLKYENGYVYQSYDSIIGTEHHNQYYFSERYDHSRTTRKHCHWWSGMDTHQIEEGLASGVLRKLSTYKME